MMPAVRQRIEERAHRQKPARHGCMGLPCLNALASAAWGGQNKECSASNESKRRCACQELKVTLLRVRAACPCHDIVWIDSARRVKGNIPATPVQHMR